ncbi:hypothetical protein AMK26_19810 [Streptomyces sp. CB03234]|uniref:hypothetical protein n=1 Tax=Streptomyces sp. (strain CB03234) TaxID=1703937 RepID=UPI00093E85B4|nr:hypothetical protein [Streptomyces sp. CB03234]OKK03685.1 hypothetical protein AMK26_19810 [Streptomyces sp. CB03234]
MDELKRRLRDAAHSHHPDRARILARVEHGIAPAATRTPWIRVAGATAAVAVVLGAGACAAAAVLGSDVADRSVSAPPADRLMADGAVAPHGNRFWAQNNVTLTAPRPLTALTVDVRVARTDRVASTGHWRTLPAHDFTVSVREDKDGALHYTWTLKPGRTAPAGRHVFAAQYNHAEGGRDATGDRYTVTATTADGQQHTARGDFAP